MAIKAKVGDVVHVRGTVVKTLDGEVGLDVGNIMGGVPHYFWIPSGCVVHVEPAPLKVGDMVYWLGFPHGETGKILAIDNGVAWVKLTKGSRLDLYLNVLERADEPRPLKVGDKVRSLRHQVSGTITVLEPRAKKSAMVQLSHDRHCEFDLSDLERVE